jgi:hypothetical protein
MRLRYIGKVDEAGEEADRACLLTPWARESYLLELPRLSVKDAGNAALFKATALYPGTIQGSISTQHVFRSPGGLVALVHITRFIGKEAQLVPQDFYRPKSGRHRILYLFFTHDWLEWMLAIDGSPRRIGAVEHSISELQANLPADIESYERIEAWCPAIMKPALVPILAREPFATITKVIRSYEDEAASILRRGDNSFGTRSSFRKKALRSFTILLVLLDLLTFAFLLSRGSIADKAAYEELRKEKTKLALVMAESAHVKSEIAALELVRVDVSHAKSDPYAVLESLAGTLPQESVILSVEIEDQSFHISGTSNNAYELVSQLESTGLFENLVLEQVTPLPESQRTRFSLTGARKHD